MIIILTVGILLVAVSFIAGKKLPPYWGFILVFLIMGFQEGVEGDFMTYKEEYEAMAVDHIPNSRTIDDEPVMPYLESLFTYFGPFWLYILVLSAFQCYVITRFVRRYCPKPYQFLAAILFYFSFNMMLLQMKALRQGLAIEMMLLAFMMADEKKGRLLSLAVVVLAYFTHNSALLIVPFYLLFMAVSIRPQLLKKKKRKIYRVVNRPQVAAAQEAKRGEVRRGALRTIIKRAYRWLAGHNVMPFVMVAIYLVLYYFKVTVLYQYMVPLILLTSGDANRLASYADTTNYAESLDANLMDISPLIVLYDAVIVFLVTGLYKSAGPRMRVFCIISIVAAFGDMLFFGAGTFARMIMYFVVFNLVVYPTVALHIRRKYGRIWVPVFILMIIGYAVKTSLPWITEMAGDRFGNYRFVFMP